MKKFTNFVPILLVCLLLTGCSTFTSLKNKFFSADKRVQTAVQRVEKKQGEIEDKGRSFVFGAKYANEFETNRSPSINLSHDFLDLATMTLGPPSIKDAQTIQEITDSLLNRTQKDLASAIADKTKAEKRLQDYVGQVVTLQNESAKLSANYERELANLRKISEVNAVKASQYDAENGFWQSLNPLSDLWKFVKKLFILSLIVGGLIIVFHVLEVFFPGLKIVSTIFGGITRLALKFSPQAKKFAGVVSDSVYKSLKSTVQGLDNVFDKLKNQPIEQSLIQNFPDSHQFNKKEVLNLLEQHSENLEKLIKDELDKLNDNQSRTIVNAIKTKTDTKLMGVPGENLII